MRSKKILLLFSFFILNSSCFAGEYKTNGVVGCTDILNLFNMYDYEPVILKSPKGYEKVLRQTFMKESTFMLQQYLLRVQKVDYKFINKMCFDLNLILNERNYSLKRKKLNNFNKKVTLKYKNKISKIRINYQYINGCEKYASSYANSLLEKNINSFNYNTVAKRQYFKCVNIQEKRFRRE